RDRRPGRLAGAVAGLAVEPHPGVAPVRPAGRGGYPPVTDLVIGADGKARCGWAGSATDYLAYHDDEWGRPVRDDDALFERLTLEAFQSGLSWLTILRKRPAFRAAFAGFAIEKVATFG